MGKSRRHIRVEPQRRLKPDYRKISAALHAYLAAQAEVDAEAEFRGDASGGPVRPRRPRRPA